MKQMDNEMNYTKSKQVDKDIFIIIKPIQVLKKVCLRSINQQNDLNQNYSK